MAKQPDVENFMANPGDEGGVLSLEENASELSAALDRHLSSQADDQGGGDPPTDSPANDVPPASAEGTQPPTTEPASAPPQGGPSLKLESPREASQPPGEGKATPSAPEGSPTSSEAPAPSAEEQELEALEPPKNASKEARAGWGELKTRAKSAYQRASAAETRARELETRLAELSEKVKGLEDIDPKQYRTLRDRVRQLDIEADPEFQADFEKRVTQADEAVYASLKANGMREETLKKIREKGLDRISDKWWQENVLRRLPLVERQLMERALTDRVLVRRDRERLIAESRANREKESARQKAEAEKDVEAAGARLQELVAQLPWALPREAPKGATKEQLEEVRLHNEHQAAIDRQFRQYMGTSTLKEKVELAVEACRAKHLDRELGTMGETLKARDARIAELEKQIAGLKGSAGVSRVVRSTPPPDQPGERTKDMNKLISMDSAEAISSGIDAMLARRR